MTSSDSSAVQWLRRLGIGAFAQRYYHQPKSRVVWLRSLGWPGAWRGLRGETEMRRAVHRLAPCANNAGGEPLVATFLTGHRFWHQTAFCAHSLAHHLAGPLQPVFFDDGTLSPPQARELKRVFPTAEIRLHASVQTTLESRLPRSRFPLLHATAAQVPIFRKLLHVRGTVPGWQLYLDSDMLFFGRPAFLETCARNRQPCYMHDPVFGYCLSPSQIAQLAGPAAPANVNTGIVGLDNDRLDWERLEALLARVPPVARLHRLFEQTLTAILLGELDARSAGAAEYAVVESPWFEPPAGTVLLHYIRNAKWPYAAFEWRRYLQAAARG